MRRASNRINFLTRKNFNLFLSISQGWIKNANTRLFFLKFSLAEYSIINSSELALKIYSSFSDVLIGTSKFSQRTKNLLARELG